MTNIIALAILLAGGYLTSVSIYIAGGVYASSIVGQSGIVVSFIKALFTFIILFFIGLVMVYFGWISIG